MIMTTKLDMSTDTLKQKKTLQLRLSLKMYILKILFHIFQESLPILQRLGIPIKKRRKNMQPAAMKEMRLRKKLAKQFQKPEAENTDLKLRVMYTPST